MYNIKINGRVWVLSIVLIGMLMSSCAKRSLTYFKDIGDQQDFVMKEGLFEEPKIVTGDLLDIKVSTQNPESNLLFNYGVVSADRRGEAQISQDPLVRGYMVDPDGNIDFPTLGTIKIAGKTKEEAKSFLKKELSNLVMEPKIEIRYLNFTVTVIGEVNRPSSFVVPTERISILEALGMAGDMTAYALRENVLLIRETSEGKVIHRFDIGEKEILTSPYYYLKQNDVIYVEADKKKLSQANVNPTTIATFSILSTLVVGIMFNFNELFR
ncbi:polysaccharide biosynthesis/export family protein [Algoriphagus antarcticus]|uniref:Polysaccharide export outer membrane protein n=2 Tax=Algoriphagus antarcticus TaxID=238540 RepID=A0A3E0DIY6_9BACT|nr:polysaccharide biosynthesis/export family protein [Algoriphagus antarcticus]REG81410.1 polysaccharide export outer membrane protein [Algoriphagus antarcticus]